MKVLSFKIEDETVIVASPCYCNGKKKDFGDVFDRKLLEKGVFVRHPEERRLMRLKIVKNEEENMEMLENVKLPGIMSVLPIFILSRITEKAINAFRISRSRFGPLPRRWTFKWDYTREEYQRENPIPPEGYSGMSD